MKASAPNFFRTAVGILLTSCASLLAQTATTDPVGFITLNVAASGGANADQLSFKGLSLTQSVVYQGSAESFGATRDIIVDNEATWTDNLFNGANGQYYLEISSGPAAGTTFDITATSDAANSVTLSEAIPATIKGVAVSAPFSFKIRKFWTIASVFGAANEGGLGGGAAGEADNILIYNPTTKKFENYFYQVSGLGTGWINAATGAPAASQKIYPDEGILIRRHQNTPVNVVLMGAVKTGSTSTPISPGLNYVSNGYAADMTLGSSGLYVADGSGVAGGAAGEADNVLIYNQATKTYNGYYYKIGGLGPDGWTSTSDASVATNVVIPSGSSFVIRRNSPTGFNWVAPQHPASL